MATNGAMSIYLENKLINHVLRNTSYTAAGSSLYIALYTNDPTDADTGTELSGHGYARVLTYSAYALPGTPPVPFTVNPTLLNKVTNYYDITFPTATGSWGNVTHYGIRTGSEVGANSGSLLFFGDMTTGSGNVNTGEALKIHAGYLTISITGGISASLAGNLLNHTLNGITYPSPGANVYAALYSTLPTVYDVGGTEISGSGCSRVQVYDGTPQAGWATPLSGSTSNSGSLVFSYDATNDWGNVRGIAIRNAVTGGSLLFLASFNPVNSVYKDDGFFVSASGLEISLYPYDPPVVI